MITSSDMLLLNSFLNLGPNLNAFKLYYYFLSQPEINLFICPIAVSSSQKSKKKKELRQHENIALISSSSLYHMTVPDF